MDEMFESCDGVVSEIGTEEGEGGETSGWERAETASSAPLHISFRNMSMSGSGKARLRSAMGAGGAAATSWHLSCSMNIHSFSIRHGMASLVLKLPEGNWRPL